MAGHDPVTGPISSKRLRELVDAPFGGAAKAIREYDPFWGRKEGEKIEFEVIVNGRNQGRAVVMAASQDEADKLADDLSDGDIDWVFGLGDFEIITVQPNKRK